MELNKICEPLKYVSESRRFDFMSVSIITQLRKIDEII